LLYHKAGYPPSTAFYNRAQTGASGLYSQDPQKTRQLLTTRVPFRDPRGKKVVYSDNDYLLLGVLVERLVGMPLDKYVEESIYKPLGITKVMFNPLQKGIPVEDTAATELAGNSRAGRVSFENIRTDVIRGEVHDEKAYYSMAGVAGHAGLFGTAKEIARLALILINQGGAGELQLFSPDVLDQFFKPSALNPTMALGWRRAGHGDRSWQFGPYASPNAVGHTGWTGTVTIIDPAQELIIVLLTNRKHSPIIEQDSALTFIGDTFETGKYGSVITLVYEALLKGQDD
jgi:N-acetylmuramoyl-L-alanine amidase